MRTAALVVAGLFLASGPASGEPGICRLDDPRELSAFLDGVTRGQARARNHPTVVAVVRDGKPFLIWGAGAVEPRTTLFRIGRLSSLFTTVAALQLVEQGKLELGTDVSGELGELHVPGPVTVGDLLSHTSGLDDRFLGLVRRPGELGSDLETFLSEQVPTRLAPPGERYRFHVWGTALLGRVMERVAGMPYERVIEEGVLRPLGMRRSRFAPGPDAEAGVGAGDLIESPGWEHRVRPVGSLRSTGAEMASFMNALLGDGKLDEITLLEPESVATLKRRSFTWHPRLPGVSPGFIRTRRGLELTSPTPPYFSRLVLLPVARVGIFVASTGARGGPLVEHLVDGFLERYFPLPPDTGPEEEVAAPETGEYVGVYRFAEYPRRNVLKAPFVFVPLAPEVAVTGLGGKLHVRCGTDPLGVELHPLDTDLFRMGKGATRAVFLRGADGKVNRLVLPGSRPVELERITWLECRPVQVTLWLLFGIFFLTLGPLAALRRVRLYMRQDKLSAKFLGKPVEARYAYLGLIATGNLVLLASPVFAFLPFRQGLPAWSFGLPLPVTLLGWAGWVLALLTLGLVPHAWRFLREPLRTREERWGYLASVVAMLAFLRFAVYWRLLAI